MRKIVALAVVVILGAGLAALSTGLPATAARPDSQLGRVTIVLEGALSRATNAPSISTSYVVPAGRQLVVESVSRTLTVPGGPGYAIINQLAVSPASAGNPPPFAAMDRTYIVNTEAGNPVYQVLNVDNGFSPAPCPADQPYIATGDSNAFTAVIGPGEQLGINMVILGLDPWPGGDAAYCLATAEYVVTGVLEPATGRRAAVVRP